MCAFPPPPPGGELRPGPWLRRGAVRARPRGAAGCAAPRPGRGGGGGGGADLCEHRGLPAWLSLSWVRGGNGSRRQPEPEKFRAWVPSGGAARRCLPQRGRVLGCCGRGLACHHPRPRFRRGERSVKGQNAFPGGDEAHLTLVTL